MASLAAPDVTAQAAQYQSQGYLHVPGIFAECLTALRDAFATFRLQQSAWSGEWRNGDTSQIDLHILHDIHHKSMPWRDVLTRPDVLSIVQACLGATPRLAATCVVSKPPSTGQSFPMHQDSAYYGPDDGRWVCMTVYLDDATPDNGPIQFVPGSHLNGKLEHVRKGKAYLPDYRLEDSVPVYAKAGDVTLFSIHTIHGSGPNRSQDVRRTVRVGYEAQPCVS